MNDTDEIIKLLKKLKKNLKALNKDLNNAEKFCPYDGCVVRYFEHYHIDEHTLTFRRPEGKNANTIS
jgi:hypothetical protein